MRSRAEAVGLLQDYDKAVEIMEAGRGNSDYYRVVDAIKDTERTGVFHKPIYSTKVIGNYIDQHHGVRGRDY